MRGAFTQQNKLNAKTLQFLAECEKAKFEDYKTKSAVARSSRRAQSVDDTGGRGEGTSAEESLSSETSERDSADDSEESSSSEFEDDLASASMEKQPRRANIVQSTRRR